MMRTTHGQLRETETEEELARLLPALWRAVVVAARTTKGLPSLPETQVAMLRRLTVLGPLTPADLAEQLHLARPTISNLVRDLVAQHLVERVPSASDGRSVLLVPTARARSVLEDFGRGRVEVVERALAGLSSEERAHVHASLPAMRHLLDSLRAGADDALDVSPAPERGLEAQRAAAG